MQIYKIGNNLTEEETAQYFQEQLQKKDINATVIYREANKTYEVFFRGYTFEVQEDGSLTNNRENTKHEIEDAWNQTITENPNISNEEKADKIEEELQQKDPDSTATYNPETDKIEVNHGGYESEIDKNGNVTVSKPVGEEEKPEPIEEVVITSQPKDVTVLEGETATFEVQAQGEGTLTYQWYKSTNNNTQGGTIITGATQAKYTTKELTAEDNNTYYYCIVTQNVNGQTNQVTSNIAKLTVEQQVKILKHPSDVTVLEGETATFEIQAQGAGTLTYKWYKNTQNSNTGGEEIQGANKSTYTTKELTASDNETYYYCEVEQNYNNKINKIKTNTAKLSVGTQMTITSPSNIDTIENTEDVTFETKATGSGTFEYKWYKNTKNSNTGGEEIQGANKSTYTIPKEEVTTSLNNTYYYCEVKQIYENKTKTKTTEPAKLNVGAKVQITEELQNQTAYEGGANVSFTIQAQGEGTLTYQWYKNTNNSNQGGQAIINETNSTYTVKPTESLNGTYYYCVVTQKYGSFTQTITSKAILLTVKTTTIKANPESITAYVGEGTQTITLSGDNAGEYSIETEPTQNIATAEISGNTITITPKAGGTTKVVAKESNGNKTVEIPIEVKTTTIKANPESITAYVGGGAQTITLSGDNAGEYSIETEPTQSIATAEISGNTITITPKAGGTTKVVAKEANGNKTVEIPIEIIANPSITIKAENNKNYVGNSTTFTATPSGTYDSVTYQWYYNTTNTEGSGTQGGTSASYSFNTSTQGTYYVSCKATYKKGTATVTVTSKAVSITIAEIPTIEITPQTATTFTGNNVTMTATVKGTYDSVTYQWYYNTTNTAGSGTQGGTSTSYIFNTNTQGTYYISCKATYTYGETTETKTSKVATITVEQANYSVTTGDTTTNYGTLAQANAGASNGSTIKLLRDTTETDVVEINKNVILDMQNNTFTMKTNVNVSTQGELKISGNGLIENINSSENNIINNGKIIIENGTIFSDTYECGPVIENNDGAELEINNGKIINDAAVEIDTILNIGKCVINNGEIYGNTSNSGILQINNGKIFSRGSVNLMDAGIGNYEGGSVTFGENLTEITKEIPLITPDNEYTYDGSKYGIFNFGGTLNFYNGSIRGITKAIENENGTVNVRNGYKIVEETDGDYATAYLIGGGDYDKEKGINMPKVSKGMIPIKWDSTNSTWVICEETDPDWYNYVDQTETNDGQSMWANVMLGDGTYKTAEGNIGKEVSEEQLGSMFVWIPRYAYNINSLYHQSSTEGGDVQIAFLEGTKEYPVGTKISYKYQGSTGTGSITNATGQGNWNEHPAFNFGGTTLAGIWVAKFEAGNISCTADKTTGQTSYSSKAIKIQPNKTSWRNVGMSNMFDVCREMQTIYSTTYGISSDTNVIDTHMMKNNEWGAVAYLAQSSYGRNKHEVSQNTNSSYLTGGGNYTSNVGQSTTKNVTGIYDMSNKNGEYVMGFVNNEVASAMISTDAKYGDLYSEGPNGGESDNYEANNSKYGDAVYETSNKAEQSDKGCWYEHISTFPRVFSPLFVRGSGRFVCFLLW